MEQIVNSFGINPKIFLAEIINFLIVLGVLYYFVFRKISVLLEGRSKKIEEGITNAEQAQETLNNAQEQKAEILHKAGEEATEEIKQAVETAKKRESEIVHEANKRADDIIQDAQSRGESLKEKLIDSSQEDIARMITLGAEKVLKSK